MHTFIAIAPCWVSALVSTSESRSLRRSPLSSPHERRHIARRTNLLSSTSGTAALDDLSQLTVAELKDCLREANLPVGGRKQDLIDRLNGHYSLDALLIADAHEHDGNNTAEDLKGLTVPVLKDRLKALGLPVGGRKQELIDRLQDHSNTSNELNDDLDVSESVENIAMLSDGDTIGETEDLSAVNESESDESPVSRRARRKKYFKTQEVRELIRANDSRAPAKAEEMIAILEMMAEEENNEEYLPGPKQYAALIDAYANSDSRNAEEVIGRIMESDMSFTTTMMNAIMGAYVNMGTEYGAEQATTILERMEYIRDFGGGVVKPTVYSYSLAISAWAKCRNVDAATRAESILTRLLESYERVSMDENEADYAQELKPNSVVFNSVIDAWANSGSLSAGEKAEVIVRKMETYSRLDHHYDVRPDTITFNTSIKAWCNSNHPDASKKADEILCKLESCPEYPKRNGGVLVVRPNLLSYNTVINSWAKSSDPDSAVRAQALLTRMLQKYRSEAFTTIKPDVVTFSSVLNALAKSKIQFKAEKCLAILESMINLHEEDGSFDTMPNVICYNTILNACAFSALGNVDGKKRALGVAVKTFKMISDGRYARPDALSYGNMLKCCSNLMPTGDARTSMASAIFSTCCNEGLVGGMVLDEIRRSVPSKEFLSLLAKCGYDRPLKQHKNAMSVELRQLPRRWTANVKAGDMTPRQRGGFVKYEGQTKMKRSQARLKAPPVVRKPGFLVEPSWASGKDV